MTEFALPSWRLLLHLVWATWWGGIFFYAIVVVPVATDAIGSVEQGFITQQVSLFHNRLSIALLFGLSIEAIRIRSLLLGILTATLALNVVLLIVWHTRLTNSMNFTEHAVPKTFYASHAVYLWMFAIEWIHGVAIACFLFRSNEP